MIPQWPDSEHPARGFHIHPVLMTSAFGFFGAYGSLAWRTFEHVLGFSHNVTKVYLARHTAHKLRYVRVYREYTRRFNVPQ